MTPLRTLGCLCVLAAIGTFAEAISGTQKVIQLLGDMQAKAKGMKNAEQVEFSKFDQFCTDKKASTAKEIKQAAELMETLAADIGKLESDIQELGEAIDNLQREVATDQASIKEAKSQRAKDKASYSEEIQDFSESVDALDRAIQVMKKRDVDQKQAGSAALLQLTNSLQLPEKIQRTVTAYLEMSTGEEGMLPSSPEANAYEFQSGGIVELLEKLHEEFTVKKTEAEKEEMNSRHAYDMISQDLHDSIENAESDIATKTGIKQEKIGINAQKKKELGVTTAGHASDTKYLSELKTECFEKSESFKEKQQLRDDEIAAIAKAMEILKSPEVLGNAEKNLPSALMQSSSLAQLRATQEPEVARVAMVKFLRNAGRKLHSQRLGMLAEKVSTTSDPFVKVKKMIDDMITRLLEETNQESEQKGFCDKELGTNKITRAKLTGTIDELSARIDESEAMITSATQRIAELAKELNEVQNSVTQSTEMRQAEKAKNAETVKDSQEALKAIEAATAVLKEFYEKASIATALLQEGKPRMGSDEWNSLANPNFEGKGGYGQGSEDKVDKGHKAGMQTFGKSYQGMNDEAGGVFAMLEVISSDFSTLEADTQSSEAAAVQAYTDFMADSKQATAVKNKESDMLTSDKASATSDKLADTKDLKATQDQLLAADRYYAKLKPTCVDSGISYADRVKAREEEIQSLKEALTILQGQ